MNQNCGKVNILQVRILGVKLFVCFDGIFQSLQRIVFGVVK